MTIVFLFASMMGSLMLLAVLLSYGAVIASLCAPLGGGALVLILAIAVAASPSAEPLAPL